MDLSKLPKSSDEPAAADPVQAAAAPLEYGHAPPSLLIAGAETWLTLIMGILLVAWGSRFGGYLLATLMHYPYHTDVTWAQGPLTGTEVAYPDLLGGVLWSESSIFFFGVALLVDAVSAFFMLARLPGRRALLWVAIFAMIAVTIYNVVAAAILFNQNVTPLLSILAVAIGGYLTFHLWAVWRALPKRRPAGAPSI